MNGVKLVALAFVVAVFLAMSVVDVAEPQAPRSRVFIKSNGDVEPASAPIQRSGNTYSFTGDVSAELTVEKGGIVIDGAGYTLHGPYNGTMENLWVIGGGADQVSPGMRINYSVGVDLSGGASGLTIRNLNIENFSIGTYLWTIDNVFVNNTVSECIVGVLLSGSENNVTRNLMVNNQVGLFFGTNEPGTVPLNLTVARNSFEDNVRQLGGCLCQGATNASELVHTWDDGREGNYWSDYNGTDADGNGVGDTPYFFDAQNEDRYPLMVNPLLAKDGTEPTRAVPVGIEILALVAVVVAVAVSAFVFRARKRKVNRSTSSVAMV